MTTRRELLIAFGGGILTAPLASFAQQQSGRIYRIGYLSPRPGIESPDEALRQGLRELGYVEGKNLVIDWRFSRGKADLLPELAAELVRLKPDCIVVTGNNATHAAKKATSTIPIVMANADDDPVRLGLVASLARPGGNITGLINIGSDLVGKRLQLLKETVPKVSRLAVLWDPNSQGGAGHVREAKAAAPALGAQIQSLEVRDPTGLESAFRAASKERAQALLLVSAGMMNSHRARIVELAVETRLPIMYSTVAFVRAGGLMSYGPDGDEQYRRAATYVDKIFKGASPADLPVERPTKFEFVINLKAAKQIGLRIPPSVLARADKVIE